MLLEVLMQYSNCHYNEFCLCIECRYREEWLYRDFSVKSKSIIPLVVTREIINLIFTVWKTGFFINSVSNARPKGLRCSIHVWNYVMVLKFRAWTTDITYCTDLLPFLHAMSGGSSLTAAFSLHWLLSLYYLKCHLASFSRYRAAFFTQHYAPWTLNKTKLTQNG